MQTGIVDFLLSLDKPQNKGKYRIYIAVCVTACLYLGWLIFKRQDSIQHDLTITNRSLDSALVYFRYLDYVQERHAKDIIENSVAIRSLRSDQDSLHKKIDDQFQRQWDYLKTGRSSYGSQ